MLKNNLSMKNRFLLIKGKLSEAVDQFNQSLEDNFFNRFSSIRKSLRFVLTWFSLILLVLIISVIQILNLNNSYQQIKFQSGGILSLGLKGVYTNSNPIFAVSSVNLAVSKLLYAGLFTYNQKNQLVGELAQNYQIKDHGKDYIVNLRPHLFWSNGQPLTAKDVVFTYNLIENHSVGSPLYSSFNSVKVQELNPLSVEFKLPNQLASFIYSLTNGIVPENVLKDIPPEDLRSSNFSSFQPIGAGPYEWQTISINGDNPLNAQAEISLVPNPYFYLGRAKISQLILETYPTHQALAKAFNSNKIDVALNLNSDQISNINQIYRYNFLFTGGTYLFFKTTVSPFNVPQIRQALEMSINIKGLIDRLDFPTHQVFGPLLVGQLGYQAKYNEANYNPNQAIKLLTGLGYRYNQNHLLELHNQPLSFSITLANSSLNHMIFNYLRNNFRSIGVIVSAHFENLNQLAIILEYHQYQSLLNSISIGLDPDVFVYWDGSQANPQLLNSLNFSEYNNSLANRSLETARITLNTRVRAIKYGHFLADWQKDVPAVGLFQPGYNLNSHIPIDNLSEKDINFSSDIFNNIYQWEINQVHQTD